MSESYHLDDELQRRNYDSALMRRLIAYLRPYRRWILLATGLLIIVAVMSNITPLLLMRALDNYIASPERTAAEAHATAQSIAQFQQDDKQGLLRLTLILCGLILVESCIRYIQILIVSVIGQKTMMEMRVDLFHHLQQLSLRFLDRNPVGRLISRVTSDVEKIQQTIVSGLVQIVSDLLTIVAVLIFMFAVNWQIALVALIPLPFFVIASFVFRKYAHQSFLEIRKKIAGISAYMQEAITGIRIIQLFNREAASFEEYRKRNEEHRDEWLKQVRQFAIYFPVIEFLSVLSMVLIIVYCGLRMVGLDVAVSGVASIGTIAGYVFWVERLYGPIRALADRYNLILEAMASSERIFQLLDEEPDLVDKPEAQSAEQIKGEVRFDNISFAYDPPQWILKNINLSIAAGERIAVVGHTGAGKSTLINLLARFYDVQQGSILIDGLDVRDYAQDSLRRQIGVVLQDVFLFSGSIRDNIRLADPTMTDERMRLCAEYVNAAKFIQRLPGGYDYIVGERGVNLSTGQRQLIAFARTLALNPRILVLDEATSNIDTETEKLIQEGIEKLLAGRTSIVIAHRLSTIQHADRIVVMHHGEIREIGSHQELLAQNGLYRKLYELQYKEPAVV